jgi:arylsulfatase A-like enzyme
LSLGNQFPSRRAFLKTGASAAAAQLPAKVHSRPNVLFILADEWRAQATGYNGDANVKTPVLDRLAGESISFDTAVGGTPVCCPARASIMTGQYPLTHGVYINDVELKPSGTTLPQLFANAGYQTGFIGKWHLYGSPDGNYGRRLAFVPPENRLGFNYWKACECTHDYNHSLYYEGSDRTPKYWPGYDAFAQTTDACQFMVEQAKGKNPWFLFLSLGPPHFPYETAPEPFRSQYATHPISLRPNVPDSRQAEAIGILRGYSAHIAALDSCLARLLKTLQSTGTAEDTIVVFTSDHGDMMLSQGLTTKLYPWDESIRIPLLVRYPRKFGNRGARVKTPAGQPDILPTLASLANLPVPDGVQGRDLSKELKHGTATGANDSGALLSLPVPITEARRYGFAEYRGLRTQRYTYVRALGAPWLLYDNVIDPYQMHNLADSPGSRSLQRDLDEQLQRELRRVHDDFLPAKAYIERGNLSHYKEVNVPVGHTKSPWGDWQSTLAQNTGSENAQRNIGL